MEYALKAEQEVPWFYESAQLAGDIHNSTALNYLTNNQLDKASSSFHSAIECYERAVNLARSDPQLYESLANARNSLMVIEISQLKDPIVSLKKALEAADNLTLISPSEVRASVQIAQSYIIYGRYLQTINAKPKERLDIIQKAIAAGEQASLIFKSNRHRRDSLETNGSVSKFNELEAHRLTAEALMQKVSVLSQKEESSDEITSALSQANSILNEAFKANPNDVSLNTSILNLRRLEAQQLQKQGNDPTDVITDATKQSVPPVLSTGQSEYLTQRLL